MAGHSRTKNGVATARLCPAIHVFVAAKRKQREIESKTWITGTSPVMTVFVFRQEPFLADSVIWPD
jgi:hypothetical protein